MNNFQTAKKPTISSSFYDSYTEKPVKWYEIVDAYRQYTETYLPLRVENYPREMWENFKKFFKVSEPDEEEEDPVMEVEQTRKDGNIVKLTQYDLSNDKYDARVSEAVRTHKEKAKNSDRQPQRPPKAEASARPVPVPVPDRSAYTATTTAPSAVSRRHRHTSNQVVPTYDDCPECRALAAKRFSTTCDCNECRAKRALNPNSTPYCDCRVCRNTKRT